MTKAGANDGVQTQAVLEAMVVPPPPAETPVANPDPRDWPRTRADGAVREQAHDGPRGGRRFSDGGSPAGSDAAAGSRSHPRRIKRGHAFLAQFGRIARRWIAAPDGISAGSNWRPASSLSERKPMVFSVSSYIEQCPLRF